MTRNPKTYDLVVLGGGPAGITGAATAAVGKSVALIDNHPALGGAGINTGTVPSKTLRETALTLSGARSRQLYGVDLSLRRNATVNDFLRRERAVKTSLNSMLAGQLAASQADVYGGAGVFEDAHAIRVRPGPAQTPRAREGGDDNLIHGGCVLVATGSSPARPAIFPFHSRGVYDSDTILNLDRLPKSLVIVGAGTIGCEYACIFAALHTQVDVVDGRSSALPFLDSEIASALTTAMTRSGIQFHWNERVESCRANADGGFTLKMSSGSCLCADAALIAAGRTSNTAGLNLGAAGVTTGNRGLIVVDEHFRTEAPHIYAAGDVIGPPALASTSMEQARRAVRHAFARETAPDFPTLLPTGIYTIPEIGMIGETEDALRRNGVEFVAGRAYYDGNARGKIIGDEQGMLKLLFRRSDLKLLGVHAIGEQATELVHVGLIAMLSNSTARIFDEACFNLPTLGQLYKTAALDAIAASRSGRKS
jgi:NAD(P) transhydrogenase